MPSKTPNSVTQAAMREARVRGLSANKKSSLLQLTPATQFDEDFIFGTFKASMKSYVEQTWGWDEDAQRRGLLSEKNLAGFQLIMLHGEKIGALLLERSEDQYHHTHQSCANALCALRLHNAGAR